MRFDRKPSLWSEKSWQVGHAVQLSGEDQTLRFIKILRALQYAVVSLAFIALAACGSSASSETVDSSSPGSVVKPAVSLEAMNTSVEPGTPATLKWSATNAQACSASGGWNGTQPTSGTTTTQPLTADTKYILTCTGPGGSAAQTAEVAVFAHAPVVTLAASPTTLANGEMSTLTWTASHASACTASGGWHGSVPTNGTWSTGALTNTSEYELTCTGPGGSATQSTTVTVSRSPPAVTFRAAPSTVDSGSASTLTWSTQNVTSCAASGAWSGNKALSGSQTTGALATQATYTLTCTGSGGSATQSATVTVKSAAPSIAITAAPNTVASGKSSTLTWDAVNATSCTASGGWSGSRPVSGSQSTGPLSSNASYVLTCSGAGGSATQSVTISVKSSTPVVILSVGPSAISSGSSATLNWSATNATACSASNSWSGSKPLSGSQSTGALTADATYTLTCTGDGGSATQSATVSVKTPAPTVSLNASPSSVVSGNSAALTWSATNSTTCTASGAWAGTKAISGSQTTGALTASATYGLTCSGKGGNAAQSTTVTVSPKPTATVSIGANPSTVTSGSASTVTWSSTNATSCSASGAWSGTKSISGSQATGALTANATYVLTCTGTSGSATQSAIVTVTARAPMVSFSASPSTVASGSASTLAWSSTNTTACTASGGWSGSKAISGSQSTGPLSANGTYGISCTGPGGNASQSVTVAVSAPAPTVTLTASPSTVASGGGSTLTWSAANATSCTASGAWSGTKPATGSQPTGALAAKQTYSITCTGTGGTATQSATVSVSAPAPTITLSASPSTVSSGRSSTLTWAATNATTCSASGAWSGTKAVSGSQSTGALSANATYGLTCAGAGGNASQSATVSVTNTPPAVSLAANPSTVKSGATSALTWTSTNATSCIASGGWNGSESMNGSSTTSALTTTTTYTLTCTGAGGSASQSATVTLTAPAPNVSLSASPSTVASGGSSTLTWSSSNATACTASGGWSGARASSGTASTGAISAATTYTLACTGAGGNATQSTTVTVTAGSTGTATLSWTAPTTNTDGTPVTPLSGYTIYYGTSQGAMTHLVAVSGAATTSYEVSGLATGTWYFAIAADAADGSQSALSNVGSKTF